MQKLPLNVRRLAEDFALEVGLPCINDGFEIAVTAISLCAENPGLLKAMNRELYPAVSEVIGTPMGVQNVRRHIDAAIDSAFTHTRSDKAYKHFENVIRADKGKPTVGEFLWVGARYVRDRMNNTL